MVNLTAAFLDSSHHFFKISWFKRKVLQSGDQYMSRRGGGGKVLSLSVST